MCLGFSAFGRKRTPHSIHAIILLPQNLVLCLAILRSWSFSFRLNRLLVSCYESIRHFLARKSIGFPPETLRVISAVDEHRQHWKPKQVRVLLLAESHVYTEDAVALNYDDFPELKSLPKKYVRLVYCLGYGENSLVDGKLTHNRGTPQFWKILSSCADAPTKKVLKTSEPDDKLRIRNKFEVLKKLRQSGVWLQDASIVALYRKGAKPTTKVRENIISECWTHYVLPQIKSEKPRPRVVVIGEHVYQILSRQTDNDVITGCIRQPQGCRRKGQFDAELKKLHAMLLGDCL